MRFLYYLFLLTCLLCSERMTAGSGYPKVILYVGKVDNDCIPDTIIGEKRSRTVTTIQSIRWGIGKCNEPTEPKKHPPHYYPVTLFNYPDWQLKQSSSFFTNLNNDSLIDIGITIKGTINNDTSSKDTTALLLIFGQSKLKEQPFIIINDIHDNMRQFKAKKWKKGTDLTDAKVRDNSGRTSYKLPHYDTDYSKDDKEDKTFTLNAQEIQYSDLSMTLYPNPAAHFVQIELKEVLPGNYQVDFYTTNAELIASKEFYCGSKEDIIQNIDVDKISSGMYVARLYHNGLLVSSYPFIVFK